MSVCNFVFLLAALLLPLFFLVSLYSIINIVNAEIEKWTHNRDISEDISNTLPRVDLRETRITRNIQINRILVVLNLSELMLVLMRSATIRRHINSSPTALATTMGYRFQGWTRESGLTNSRQQPQHTTNVGILGMNARTLGCSERLVLQK